jgi:hypothetical protein
MNTLFAKKWYIIAVFTLVLAPNLFVVIAGIESFPFTQAPMFAHHIDKNSDFYVFKFEGVTADKEILNLEKYYGTSERDFVRHFFGKAYGVASGINPFSNKLGEDTKEKFEARMRTFFKNYTAFLKKEYNLSFNEIQLSIKKVDYYRNDVSNYNLIGIYNCSTNQYMYGEKRSSINN